MRSRNASAASWVDAAISRTSSLSVPLSLVDHDCDRSVTGSAENDVCSKALHRLRCADVDRHELASGFARAMPVASDQTRKRHPTRVADIGGKPELFPHRRGCPHLVECQLHIGSLDGIESHRRIRHHIELAKMIAQALREFRRRCG